MPDTFFIRKISDFRKGLGSVFLPLHHSERMHGWPNVNVYGRYRGKTAQVQPTAVLSIWPALDILTYRGLSCNWFSRRWPYTPLSCHSICRLKNCVNFRILPHCSLLEMCAVLEAWAHISKTALPDKNGYCHWMWPLFTAHQLVSRSQVKSHTSSLQRRKCQRTLS